MAGWEASRSTVAMVAEADGGAADVEGLRTSKRQKIGEEETEASAPSTSTRAAVLSRKGGSYYLPEEGKGTFAEGGLQVEEPITRFVYNQEDVIGACDGFVVFCPFRREKSATIEAQNLILEVAPKTKFETVRSASRGKCVLRLGGGDRGRRQGAPLLLQEIMERLDSGVSKLPKFCHRLVPIQAICVCQEEELRRHAKVILAEVKDPEASFAVSCKTRRVKVEDGDDVNVLDVLAKTYSVVFPKAKVDLKNPKVVLLCETFGTNLCAISAVTSELIQVRAKGISIRPLAAPSVTTNNKE